MDQPTTPAGRPMVGAIRSEQEHADLLGYHIRQITDQEQNVEAAKPAVNKAKQKLSDANEELTKRFNAAKADLGRGYTREYLASLIKDGKAKIRDLVGVEKQRARDKAILNQPVFGLQAELFPGEETPTAARDEMQWAAEGLLRGQRGDLKEIQDGDPPEFHQTIMKAYELGQGLTRERVKRAMELKQQQGQPKADDDGRDLNAPEPGTPEADAAEKKSIARAKKSLQAMGSGEANPADDFEAPAAELEKQSTRKAVRESKGAAAEAVH